MVVHEEHSDLHMIEEDQLFDFPLGKSHTLMEEEEKHTIVKIDYGGIHASTCLVDENCRRLFGMHDLKETPYEIPIWMAYSSLEEVAYHIPYGSKNKISYLSTNWVGIGINEMNNLEGKWSFNFCNNFFVITNIVLKCEQQQS